MTEHYDKLYHYSMKGKVRKKYDKEFKLLVVNLCLSGRDAKEVASEMDIDKSIIQQWVREYHTYPDNSFKGNDNAVAESFFKIIKSEMIDHKYNYAHFLAKNRYCEFY